MEIKKFKDKYFEDLIIGHGTCYSVKDEYKNKLKNYQHTVFALELEGNDFKTVKDFNSSLSFELKGGDILKLSENIIVTTACDLFKKKELFFKIYEENSIKVSEFINEYQESFDKKNKISRPKRISRK